MANGRLLPICLGPVTLATQKNRNTCWRPLNGSITIGFGTRNAPVAGGGTGTVEIDDIGLIM